MWCGLTYPAVRTYTQPKQGHRPRWHGSSLNFLTRELLGRKGNKTSQAALNFIEAPYFFSQRLRSLRAAAFSGGFVPSNELSVQACQWHVFRRELERPRMASKVIVWWNKKGNRRLHPLRLRLRAPDAQKFDSEIDFLGESNAIIHHRRPSTAPFHLNAVG